MSTNIYINECTQTYIHIYMYNKNLNWPKNQVHKIIFNKNKN